MPEITPNLTDPNRCVSVHWSLPVQCVLPRTHAGIWHEAWHPQSGNRMRYRRAMSVFVTEDLHDGSWHDLGIPAPGVVCGEPHSERPGVFCQMEHGEDGNRWNHVAVVDGCRYSWKTPLPRPVGAYQLGSDIRSLRAQVEELHAELIKTHTDLDGGRLGLWEEEQDTARLRLALKSAKRGRAGARRQVAELESAGVEARAALGSLCYDLEDPGTAAYGALYLISKATSGVKAPRDFAAEALAKHDAEVLRRAAEALEGADRDDDAVNLLYQLASDTEKAATTEVGDLA